MMSRFAICLVFILLVSPFRSRADQRMKIDWQDFADSTFVFKITNKEAEKFLKEGGSEALMEKLLYCPVGSFKDYWADAPYQGHFIFANIRKNKIDFRYAPCIPFEVFLFKEYGMLSLQVIDEEGEVRSDANVRIQSGTWRIFDPSIRFDAGTQTYRIDDWSEDRKRPLKKDLQVWMNADNGRYKQVSTVSPYHPGGFAGAISMHDSLKLTLDRDYYIQLRDDKGKVVSSTKFHQEVIELNNTSSTRYRIPARFFEDMDVEYRVDVWVTTNDGQRLSQSFPVKFFRSYCHVFFPVKFFRSYCHVFEETQGDSIYFRMHELRYVYRMAKNSDKISAGIWWRCRNTS